MTLYLDTSALIKLYHEESGTENLIKLIHQSADDLIITIADITLIEFHSALLKRVRTKEIPLNTVKKVFELFQNDLKVFNVIVVDEDVKNLSIRLIDTIGSSTNLRTLDALQLATAIIVNRMLAIDYFIACDKALLASAKRYFTPYNPETDMI